MAVCAGITAATVPAGPPQNRPSENRSVPLGVRDGGTTVTKTVFRPGWTYGDGFRPVPPPPPLLRFRHLSGRRSAGLFSDSRSPVSGRFRCRHGRAWSLSGFCLFVQPASGSVPVCRAESPRGSAQNSAPSRSGGTQSQTVGVLPSIVAGGQDLRRFLPSVLLSRFPRETSPDGHSMSPGDDFPADRSVFRFCGQNLWSPGFPAEMRRVPGDFPQPEPCFVFTRPVCSPLRSSFADADSGGGTSGSRRTGLSVPSHPLLLFLWVFIHPGTREPCGGSRLKQRPGGCPFLPCPVSAAGAGIWSGVSPVRELIGLRSHARGSRMGTVSLRPPGRCGTIRNIRNFSVAEPGPKHESGIPSPAESGFSGSGGECGEIRAEPSPGASRTWDMALPERAPQRTSCAISLPGLRRLLSPGVRSRSDVCICTRMQCTQIMHAAGSPADHSGPWLRSARRPFFRRSGFSPVRPGSPGFREISVRSSVTSCCRRSCNPAFFDPGGLMSGGSARPAERVPMRRSVS